MKAAIDSSASQVAGVSVSRRFYAVISSVASCPTMLYGFVVTGTIRHPCVEFQDKTVQDDGRLSFGDEAFHVSTRQNVGLPRARHFLYCENKQEEVTMYLIG